MLVAGHFVVQTRIKVIHDALSVVVVQLRVQIVGVWPMMGLIGPEHDRATYDLAVLTGRTANQL